MFSFFPSIVFLSISGFVEIKNRIISWNQSNLCLPGDTHAQETKWEISTNVSYPHRCSSVGWDGSQGDSDKCGRSGCSHTLRDHKCSCLACIHLSQLQGGNRVYPHHYTCINSIWIYRCMCIYIIIILYRERADNTHAIPKLAIFLAMFTLFSFLKGLWLFHIKANDRCGSERPTERL